MSIAPPAITPLLNLVCQFADLPAAPITSGRRRRPADGSVPSAPAICTLAAYGADDGGVACWGESYGGAADATAGGLCRRQRRPLAYLRHTARRPGSVLGPLRGFPISALPVAASDCLTPAEGDGPCHSRYYRTIPTQPLAGEFVAVAAGGGFSCGGARGDGALKCWGRWFRGLSASNARSCGQIILLWAQMRLIARAGISKARTVVRGLVRASCIPRGIAPEPAILARRAATVWANSANFR